MRVNSCSTIRKHLVIIFDLQIFRALHEAGADLNGVTFLPTLLHPKSVGRISLRSRDPLDPPQIDPNYLDHSDDIEHLLYGLFPD